jgi:hypothetical protein
MATLFTVIRSGRWVASDEGEAQTKPCGFAPFQRQAAWSTQVAVIDNMTVQDGASIVAPEFSLILRNDGGISIVLA